MEFSNVYDDDERARAYDALEFPGTYILAYRDLPALFAEHVSGTRALDFGCGTGRSTRFLTGLGFDALGVDIAERMVARARRRDPEGDYRVLGEGDLDRLPAGAFDLVLAAFTFDNIPTAAEKSASFAALARRLAPDGRLVSVVSSPEIYVNEWASFTTRDYPENRAARTGDRVKIVMLDVEDRRPVEDVIWFDDDYRSLYRASGLAPLAVARPLATGDEPVEWVSERTIAPWTIWVLGRTG